MKKYLTIIKVIVLGFLFSIPNVIHAQEFESVISTGGTGYDSGNQVVLDDSGNKIILGRFNGTVDFDPGVNTANLIAQGTTSDIYIQKLGPSNNLIWVKQIESSNTLSGLSIAIDENSNIYTTGFYDNTVDFDPGTNTSNLTSQGNFDCFIQKLDSNGDFIWVKNIGGTGIDEGQSIKIANSKIHISGFFDGTCDFDPSASSATLTSGTHEDVFVLQLDLDGNYEWAVNAGSNFGPCYANALIVNSNNDILVTGEYFGEVDFDPGATVFNLPSGAGSQMFVWKLDENGVFIDAFAVEGGSSTGYSIVLDSDANIYVTGRFGGTADFDIGTGTTEITSVGTRDCFLLKIDSNSDFDWVKSVGSTGISESYSVDIDSYNNVYFAGYIDHGSVDLNPNAGSETQSSNQGDAFVVSLNQNGDYQWGLLIGDDGFDIATSIVLTSNDNLIVLGELENTVDFDNSSGTNEITSNGSSDAFLLELTQPGLSTNTLKLSSKVNAYPNPVANNLFIESSLKNYSISIGDLSGRIIFSKENIGTTLFKYPFEEKPGIYIVEIKNETERTVFKIIKQ